MMKNSYRMMSVLTNAKVKFDCITKKQKLQLENVDVEDDLRVDDDLLKFYYQY